MIHLQLWPSQEILSGAIDSASSHTVAGAVTDFNRFPFSIRLTDTYPIFSLMKIYH